MFATMEASTRLRDILRGTALESNERLLRLEDIELMDMDDRDALMFSARGLVYDDFARILAGHVVWFSPNSFIVDGDTQYEFRHTDFESQMTFIPMVCLMIGSEDGEEIRHRVYISTQITADDYNELGAERSLVIEDVTSTLIQLLSELQVNALTIQWAPRHIDRLPQPSLPVSETALSLLLRHGRNLHLTIQNFAIHNAQVGHLLGIATSITCLYLRNTAIADASLASFREGLASNLGPERLSVISPPAHLPFFEVFGALSTNTRLSHLTLVRDGGGVCDADAMLQLEPCIRENRGLKHLELRDYPIRGDAWVTFWRALGQHPCLQYIDFSGTDWPTSFVTMDSLAQIRKQLKIRTRVVAKSIASNMSLQHLGMLRSERDEDIWNRLVAPRIEFNLHIDRFERIKQGNDSVRRSLLLRMLGKVSMKSALLHLCLSKNMDLIDEFTSPDAILIPIADFNPEAVLSVAVARALVGSLPEHNSEEENAAMPCVSLDDHDQADSCSRHGPTDKWTPSLEPQYVFQRRVKTILVFTLRLGNALLSCRND